MPLPFNYIDSLRSGCTTPEPCGSTAPACIYFSGFYPHPGSSTGTAVVTGIAGAFGCSTGNHTDSLDDSSFGSSTTCPIITFIGAHFDVQFDTTAVSLYINYGTHIARFGFDDACSVIHAIDALVSGATVEFPFISDSPPAGCDYSAATVNVTLSL